MPRAKKISLNNTLIDIGDGNCEIWDVTESSGTYSITGHSTPYADITTALNNNTSVVLRHPDGRLFYLAGNFGSGNEARYSFTYNEATARMIIGIYSNNTITYTTPTGGAPQFHRSTDTTYGIGSENYYGHNKVINNLTTASYTEGESLSAYQGKVLNDGLLTAFKRKAVTETNTNLNDYRVSGVYYFNSGTTPTNIPAGVNGILIVCSMQPEEQGSNTCKQIWLRQGTPGTNSYQMWERSIGSASNNNWSEWVRYLTDKDAPTIPNITSVGSSNLSVASSTNTNAGDMTLSAGLWLVTVTARWTANATGYRQCWLSTTSTGSAKDFGSVVSYPACNGVITSEQLTCYISISSQTTYYIVVNQNSGGALNVNTRYSACRLGDA